MKRKNVWFVLFLLSIASMTTFAQTYDRLWKEVEEANRKGLPRTAVKLADDIFRKAEKEKNSPQMLKAYTARSMYREQISPDSFYVDLKGLEQWAETVTKTEDAAVLHTLIARMYGDYALDNRWALRQRTDVQDTPAEDMREWSGNIFRQKVLDHAREALKEPGQLFGLSAEGYVPFVVTEADSRYYHHNMYQFLASENIGSLRKVAGFESDSLLNETIRGIYSGLDGMYRERNNRDALLLVALDALEWRLSTAEITQESYLQELDQLIRTYNDREICAEAYLAKAWHLMSRNEPAEAFRACEEAIGKYPKYKRVGALQALRQNILSPLLNFQLEGTVYPEHPFDINVTHRNLSGFTVDYYRVNLPAGSPLLQAVELKEEFLKKHARKIRSEHIALVRPEGYAVRDTTLRLTSPSEGIYVARIAPDDKSGNVSYSLLPASRFKILSRRLPANRYEIVLPDALTGRPIAGARVKILSSRRGEMQEELTLTTGADGRVEFPWKDDYTHILAEKGKDALMTNRRIYGGYYSFSENAAANEQVRLLTDRALYRPGQTVYVKGIAYSQLSDTASVVPDKNIALTLNDPNSREVGKKEVRTNEYGSFTAEFTLPSAGLNGIYYLSDGKTTATIRVEEYKRPTFDITFDKQAGSYQLGDSVQVRGSVKTYSGVVVRDLPVSYTVTRHALPWWGRFRSGSTLTASGTATLDSSGKFALPVRFEPDKNQKDYEGYYVYTVAATVTNEAGETQTTEVSLSAGKRSLLLSVQLPEKIDKTGDVQAEFLATNLSGQPIDVQGAYTLYPFTDYASRTASETPALTGAFTSNRTTQLPGWKSLPSGAYKLVLSAKDEQGRDASFEAETILFSPGDTRPPVEVDIWYHEINTAFDASRPASFVFGTSHKDAWVLMDVFSGNRRLESKTIHLSDSLMRFDYPYRKEYGDGLGIVFCFVKDNKVYTREVKLTRKIADKQLRLSWEVFRDKLRPGQQEEWRLTVRNPQGAPADAEVLATMYDASLDKIWKRAQDLQVRYSLYLPVSNWMVNYSYFGYHSFWFRQKEYTYPELKFDRFWMDASYASSLYSAGSMQQSRALGIVADSDNVYIRGVPAKAESLAAPVPAGTKFKLAHPDEVIVAEAEEAGSGLPEATPGLRTNFAETAFFYPQLRTNERGEVVVAFTVPESLTRWNFNAYAHTRGMLTGMLSGETVTSKEFMLTPNLPRFVRVGDQTSVAATIANLTGHTVSGTAVLTLFDPLTEKVISTRKQPFTAEAGQTTAVSFTFTADDKYDLLGCRLVADGGSFSDGEQHLLPVLSNKETILETVAMPIRGNQAREFSLGSLFNNNSKTAVKRRLTVEFSGNPAWYAVQALPSLGLPNDDNAISWAAAYYANSLASHIVNSQPRVRTIFDAWKLQGGTKETFLSNLQKNQEVKNILLEESPWLMEATTEQEQMERVATLFDLNNIQNNNLAALTKLKDLQLVDGSWTWYKGMTGSRYITNFVLQSLVRLDALTGKPSGGDVAEMKQQAFGYLHNEALAEYNRLREAEKANGRIKGISADALQYLYLIALSGEQVPEKNKAAYAYYLGKVSETLPALSVTGKARAAVIFHRAGRAADAKACLASLEEFTTRTDELGVFFDFRTAPYLWEGLKVPAHVAVMEAFDLAGNDPALVEEMKLWLLKQKQTLQWDSPAATVNAVYALLNRGSNLLDNQGDVRIRIGNRTWETLSPAGTSIPGSAYIKETVTDPKTLSKPGKAVVEKRDAGIAWGAVYAQYEEDLDKITQYGEGLGVEKKLYVEKITGSRKELAPVTDGTILAVGDKVVARLTIRLDRPMDFVQLKDQRGACFEPLSALSGYNWNRGIGYYVAVKDASTNFFFDSLAKGVYVLEYGYRVSRAGTYESGLAIIQSAYAPEYASRAPSVQLKVED